MDLNKLIQMLSWKTPSGSPESYAFANAYLKSFGEPDEDGNYLLVIGHNPKVAHVCHYDTVHSEGGIQGVYEDGGYLYSDSNDCLGADDKTGIFILLQLIQAGTEGVYIVFDNEEVGCIGSSAMAEKLHKALLEDTDHPLKSVDIMISYDRKGTQDIITHQMGSRTCSDEFAKSLAKELEMEHKPDPTGSYTDSNEFAGLIPECTNLSVGYESQHTAKERQDIQYLDDLIYNLRFVEWDNLTVARTPEDPVSDNYGSQWGCEELDEIESFVREHPEQVAKMLSSYNFHLHDLYEECEIDPPGHYTLF